MRGSSLVDAAVIGKLVDLYHRLPNIQLGEAMKLAGFSDDEINPATRRIIQRALPGGSLKTFRAFIAAPSTPPPSRQMRNDNRLAIAIAIFDGTTSSADGTSTTPVLESAPSPPNQTSKSISSLLSSSASSVILSSALLSFSSKRKRRNAAYYMKKKVKEKAKSTLAKAALTTAAALGGMTARSFQHEQRNEGRNKIIAMEAGSAAAKEVTVKTLTAVQLSKKKITKSTT